MNPKLDPRILRLFLTCLVLLGIPGCICQNQTQYETCNEPFQCGSLSEIRYPFYGGSRPLACGYPGFELTCPPNDLPRLNISSIIYRVLQIDNSSRILRVARNDLWGNLCPTTFSNTTLDPTIFELYSSANGPNITLYYGCYLPPSTPVAPNQFDCNVNGVNRRNFIVTSVVSLPTANIICSNQISVLVNQEVNPGSITPVLLPAALEGGFSIQYSAENANCSDCLDSGGLCGYSLSATSFTCHCTNGTSASTCNALPTGNRNGSKTYVIIGVSLGIAALIIPSIIVVIIIKKGRLRKQSQVGNQNVDKYLLNHGSLAPKRYSYKEIKQITKTFAYKLGQGGYGIVYKGELPDGQLVAVKVLSDASDSAEDFINEVASISRTSHINIVNLLGFCYNTKQRALVYEFMPNKSLDKFIYKCGSSDPECSLEWEKLYEIAIGIARGLEYLHRGCNTRIVHFDIKPQNILLDEDFCPKISDFGLAKLFKKQQSKISMLGARGTIGYIAPEVFSRNFGVVSHKSDVYSYGMMLLEMAEAGKIVGIEVIQSSEDYFPDKIYDYVLLKNISLVDLISDEKEETVRKMLLVGLWCIQTAPSDRPSMTKVVEMLEGSLQSIQVPPKPFLSSTGPSIQQFSSSLSAYVEKENSSEG